MGSDFASYNPATGALIWHGRAALAADVDQAIDAAKQALGAWRKHSFEERADCIERFSKKVHEKKDSLAEIISDEVGKTHWESLQEVTIVENKAAISIEAHRARASDRVRHIGEAELITRSRPHGIVAVISPFNFPAHLANGHIVPALLAGNVVLWKPSELAPKVAEYMASLWHEVGLPQGVLQLLQGAKATAEWIVDRKEVMGIFFNGSVRAGREITERSKRYPGRILALELGGVNPLVVSKVHDIDATVFCILQSAFLTSGQRCTAARKLLLTEEAPREAIMKRLVEMASHLEIGPHTERPEPYMGPLVHPSHADRVYEGYERLKKHGGTVLLEMKRLPLGPAFLSCGIVDMTACGAIDEEFFGPLLQYERVGTLNDAIERANQSAYGLSCSLLSDDREEYLAFLDGMQAGVINWNTPSTGASGWAPFGGIKASGNHRPSAYYACDYVTYPTQSCEAAHPVLPASLPPGLDFS